MSLEAVRASLGVLSVALCVLMAIFLLCSGGSLRRANRYLAAFVLVTAVDLLGWGALLLPEAVRQPLLLRTPLAFLQMPLLYAYAVALCFPQRRRRGHLLGGGLLVLLAAAVLLPRALAWLAPATSAGGAGSNLDQVLIELGLHLQFYLYIGLLLHLLWQYRRQYRATQSHPGSLTLRWLATVVAVSFAAHSLVLLKSLLWIGGATAGREGMDLLVGVVAVAVMCAMTLAALVRQELFIGIVEEPVPLPDPTPSVAAGIDSDGHDDDCNDDPGALPRLLDYMQQHQPFLDPGLTIRGLARRMGMGQRELSVLINQRIGLHFFDFINRYRIELAAAWLRAPERRQQSILEIADAVGFNSKSSFNAAFSKHLQMTPSAWRRATAAATGPLPLS